mmetsp:Transcript_129742/g.361422  ORF Transcript_129742/g.361422 Transcript_129742/m.361422 type:complete len:348 (+) Transcript_129742:1102-2145(+)
MTERETRCNNYGLVARPSELDLVVREINAQGIVLPFAHALALEDQTRMIPFSDCDVGLDIKVGKVSFLKDRYPYGAAADSAFRYRTCPKDTSRRCRPVVSCHRQLEEAVACFLGLVLGIPLVVRAARCVIVLEVRCACHCTTGLGHRAASLHAQDALLEGLQGLLGSLGSVGRCVARVQGLTPLPGLQLVRRGCLLSAHEGGPRRVLVLQLGWVVAGIRIHLPGLQVPPCHALLGPGLAVEPGRVRATVLLPVVLSRGTSGKFVRHAGTGHGQAHGCLRGGPGPPALRRGPSPLLGVRRRGELLPRRAEQTCKRGRLCPWALHLQPLLPLRLSQRLLQRLLLGRRPW